MEEDDAQRPPPTHQVGQDLADLSIDELDERMALLRREIERLASARAAKTASADAAEAFFKKS